MGSLLRPSPRLSEVTVAVLGRALEVSPPVESPLEWPGVHATEALVDGKPLEGYWFNRTKEWAARRRREEYGTHDYATRYEVELSPLPAFRDLSPEAYREKVAELVREIEEEGERARKGRRWWGWRRS